MSDLSDSPLDAPLKTETVIDPQTAAAPKPLSTAVLVLGFIVCALLGMLLASGLRKMQTTPAAKEESLAVLADRLEDQAEAIANRARRFEAELRAKDQEIARQKAATEAAEKHNRALQDQITRLRSER